MSERVESDIERLWILNVNSYDIHVISVSSQNRLIPKSFKFRAVLCRIRPFLIDLKKLNGLGLVQSLDRLGLQTVWTDQ